MDVSAVKKFTNIQTTFMFHCYIPPINGVFEQATNFTILARTTGILAKIRETAPWRYNNRQIGMPQGISHDGEWTVTVNLDEGGTVLRDFIKWFYKVDQTKFSQNDYKVNAIIQLLNLDSSITNTAYALIGAFPKNIPGIESLEQDATEGHVTFDCTFSVDDIAHGTVNNGTINWVENSSDIYFPYKSILKQLTTVPLKANS